MSSSTSASHFLRETWGLKVVLFWRVGRVSVCGLCLPAQLHCVAVSWSSATTWSVPHRRTAELSLVLTQIYCKRCIRNEMNIFFFFWFTDLRISYIALISYWMEYLMQIRTGLYFFLYISLSLGCTFNISLL